jgi:hypothetical protein
MLRAVILLTAALPGVVQPVFGQAPPRSKGRLLRWLQRGAYRQAYTPEPEVHRSLTSAHGINVRTWYSPVLTADLRAGRPTFRKGAAMVKELYAAGDQQVLGWSVMRKLRRKSGRRGKGWLFYERLPGGDVYFGRGLGVCTTCHRAGTDYLLSPFRPDAVPP